MGITFGDQPPDEPSRAAGEGSRPAAAPTDRPVYEKEARAPRGRKAIYVETLTQARLVQASAELKKNVNDMAEAALQEYLKREASMLFEREFAEANERSTYSTIHRHEFAEKWRAPAWAREPK